MSDDRLVGEVVVSACWYSLSQVCEICGIEAVLVAELAAHGVINPPGGEPEMWSFSEHDLLRSQKAIRLRNDLGIDWAGLALALDLLEEIERLRAQVARHRSDETATTIDSGFSQ